MPLQIMKVRLLVWSYLPEWNLTHAHGPCGPVAQVVAEAIGGKLHYCLTASHPAAIAEAWYGHYVVIKDKKVVDPAGVFIEGFRRACYRDMRPDTLAPVYTPEAVAFWRTRLGPVLR